MRERIARRRRRVLVGVVAGCAVVAMAVGATYSPIFDAREIAVEGARTLTPDEVISLAGIQLGDGVFHLDTAGVERRLEEEPWIGQATIERDLPASVTIVVVERRPIARGPAGELIAGDGVLLPGEDDGDLPTIGSSDGVFSGTDRTSAASVLAALDPVVRIRVEDVTVRGDGEITLELSTGVAVRFGGPDERIAKGGSLRALLRWGSQRGVAFRSIDVTVPSAPSAVLTTGATVAP